jgi:DNA (cytosine-5)-methyltransferase 1
MPRSPKLISLFTGAGGLDLGFEAAGFDTAVAVEMDGMCCKTLRHNRAWPVIHRDIHDVPSSEILASAGLVQGEAELLIGGPPCQPFSKSGFWATGDSKRLKDPRASTLDAYLRVLEDTLPQAFLLENVAGIAFKGKSEGLEYLRERVAGVNHRMDVGYKFETIRVNAAHYGVPQIRERMLIVGHRDGLKFGRLDPTHSLQRRNESLLDLEESHLLPFTNAWDAIGHLATSVDEELGMSGKWADLLPSIPEGENYLYHTERGGGEPLFGWRRRFWNFLLKLAKDKPSWTLTAQPGPATGPFHWDNRHLSAVELCALQTFPSGYEVLGSRIDVQKQVGNAVPSALAELMGLKMRARFFGETEMESVAVTLIPEKRNDLPPPCPVVPVARKYRSLCGEHDAHPGTGKGYGALRMQEKIAV